MTPERWQSIKFVYEQVDSVAPELRDDLLARLCQTDAALRREVEQLFDSEDGEESGAFIQRAIFESIDEVPAVPEPAEKYKVASASNE